MDEDKYVDWMYKLLSERVGGFSSTQLYRYIGEKLSGLNGVDKNSTCYYAIVNEWTNTKVLGYTTDLDAAIRACWYISGEYVEHDGSWEEQSDEERESYRKYCLNTSDHYVYIVPIRQLEFIKEGDSDLDDKKFKDIYK